VKTRRRAATNLGLALLSFLLSSLLMDRVLALCGFSDEWTASAANPANYHERRVNIEYAYEFQTNGQGLREREIPLQRPLGVSRIFVAGDSFTEGVGVAQDQTFVTVLEKELQARGKAVQTINGGLDGAGPREYGRLFLEVGVRYRPDVLLLSVYANDVSDTPAEAAAADLERARPHRTGIKAALHRAWPRIYTLLLNLHYGRIQRESTRPRDLIDAVSRHARRLGIPPSDIDAWKARLPAELTAAANEGRFNGYVLSHGLLRRDWWTDALDLGSAQAEARFRAMLTLLAAVAERSRRLGITPALVFLPSRLQYDCSLYEPGATNLWRQVGIHVRPEWCLGETPLQLRLRTWAAQEGLPLLDLTDRFRHAIRGSPLTWTLDEHWTPEGHRVAASAIAEWLLSASVFPGTGGESTPGRGGTHGTLASSPTATRNR
jgi:lysophospholipase L1-like esterase